MLSVSLPRVISSHIPLIMAFIYLRGAGCEHLHGFCGFTRNVHDTTPADNPLLSMVYRSIGALAFFALRWEGGGGGGGGGGGLRIAQVHVRNLNSERAWVDNAVLIGGPTDPFS